MKKNNDIKDYKRPFLILVTVVFAILLFCLCINMFRRNSTDEPFGESVAVITAQSTESTTENITQKPVETATEETTSERSEEIRSESGRIIINPKQDLWNLVVVNSSREIPADYEPELKEILSTGYYMDERVVPFYEEMYKAAKEDGVTLTPYSGYRSYARQERNYNNLTEEYMSRYSLSREEAAKKAAEVILPPGTSEHNLGLAMDICNTLDSFAETKEYKWLTENAHRYGFILRYTKEKKPVTGIVDEPWHWRYVGVEYAEDIKNSGLCLEEYLDMKGIAY